MSVWDKIKNIFSKKGKTKLLTEGTQENIKTIDKSEFKKQLQEDATRNLTQEQLKRKFIMEELEINCEFIKNPNIYDEILKFLDEYIGTYSEISLEKFEEYKKGIKLDKISDNEISLAFKNEAYIAQLLSIEIQENEQNIYSTKITREPCMRRNPKYGEIPTYKYNTYKEQTAKSFDSDSYIEMSREHKRDILDDNFKSIQNIVYDRFERDEYHPEYVLKNDEKELIDISAAVDDYDISTLDGAVNGYDTTRLAQLSNYTIYRDDKSRKRAHQDNVRKKIEQSNCRNGFCNKYEQYKDLKNNNIKSK